MTKLCADRRLGITRCPLYLFERAPVAVDHQAVNAESLTFEAFTISGVHRAFIPGRLDVVFNGKLVHRLTIKILPDFHSLHAHTFSLIGVNTQSSAAFCRSTMRMYSSSDLLMMSWRTFTVCDQYSPHITSARVTMMIDASFMKRSILFTRIWCVNFRMCLNQCKGRCIFLGVDIVAVRVFYGRFKIFNRPKKTTCF